MQAYGHYTLTLILSLSLLKTGAQQTINLHSAIVNDNYSISVALPDGYDTSHAAYPVLYLTDANSSFAAAAKATKHKPMIVVGIGYRTDSLAKLLRLRDMTPDYDPALPRSHAGRSAPFLRFIKEELMPYIRKNYRTSNDAAYAGSAIGGLFGLYVLFHEPETFHRYLIVSPSIWYDSTVIFKYEHQYAQNHHDLPARVYLTAGGQEETEAGFTRMETNLKKLAATLTSRHYPHLRINIHMLEKETHFSVLPTALDKGLRELYRD